MAKQAGPMSGFRDMLADQMIPRQEALDTVRSVYESYGFVPLKTPALERLQTLTGKYGEEGEGLIYKFQDNGGRDVAMRYDQTVPLARVVAQHASDLPSPYKRYALGEVWRGERPGAGRYREFTQFDADTVGTLSYLADAEIIAMMQDSMSALGLATRIRVNDRRLLDGLATACAVEGEAGFKSLVGSIDKIDKIGRTAVLDEIRLEFGDDAAQTADKYLDCVNEPGRELESVLGTLKSEVAREGVENLQRILGALARAGYSKEQIVFDPTIARGLDYYTSTIYETMLTDLPEIGSVCSGGRYDNLIEQMGGPATPAVGTSIGVDRLIEGMRQLGQLKEVKTNTHVVIAALDVELDEDRFEIVQSLRAAGISADLVFESAKLGKQFKKIEQLGVNTVLLFGAQERDKGVVIVKDLTSGEQTEVPLEKLTTFIKGVNDGE
ncbi:histidine--tRNA ligase [Candidatus Saccharibacteria bacterium]|nr:histidine--tRNA ligase [Candidatus Saccharibacteria bacterium]